MQGSRPLVQGSTNLLRVAFLATSTFLGFVDAAMRYEFVRTCTKTVFLTSNANLVVSRRHFGHAPGLMRPVPELV